DEKAPGVNQFLIRRARTDLRGKLPGPVEYRLHIDFGEGKVTLVDAYADVHADSLLSIRVGKFKGPLGLERLQSASDRIFAEGGYPTQLVPNRDIGVQISGSVGNGLLAYQAAVQ